jgi:hypothetical protein
MNYNKNKEDKDLLFQERSINAVAGAKITEESPVAAGSKPVFDDEDPWMKSKK